MANLTENGRIVIERRIAARDENGNPLETAEEIFRRVANAVAEADRKYGGDDDVVRNTSDKFFNLMDSLDFIPNSPTLVNAGRELGQLSACFVLPVEDSIDGIFRSIGEAAKIHKTGGGTGFSFSRLRGDGSFVKETSGVASGPVSFMRVFDSATAAIKQGGTRRGANMGILRVDHPDIRQFINIKNDLSEMTNFNISVAITDEFLFALNENKEYDLKDPRDGTVIRRESAKQIWSEIISSAHRTGDPGIIFIDRINEGRANPVPGRGPIEATNPCGEQPLYPYDSCNLGSINLSNFVRDGGIDINRLKEVTGYAVHFLDNVIDVTKSPMPEIDEVNKSIRRIGLGVMGWADMLIKLNIPYDSYKALEVAELVMSSIQHTSEQASIILGMKRGSFPDFDRSIYVNKGYPALRNSTRTTIAPTGTISIIAGCSSGIEPIFRFKFIRSHYLDKTDPNKRTELEEVYPGYEEGNPVYVDSSQVTPEFHLLHQATFQKHTDNAVSKTINLPESATLEDVEMAYMGAYIFGCNGVTIYRDGSRDNQILRGSTSNAKGDDGGSGERGRYSGSDIVSGKIDVGIFRKKLPDIRNAINHKFTVGDFEGYISVGMYDSGQPGEVFIVGNKSGSTTRGYLDVIGTLLSLALQYGIPLDKITEKLSGTRFDPAGLTGDSSVPVATSIPDYVVRWLSSFFASDNKSGNSEGAVESNNKSPSGNMCPECDSAMFYGEGCETCVACGYSKCG